MKKSSLKSPKVKEKAKPKESAKSNPPPRLINRELSWLQFNRRVLMLAQSANIPLIERLKFLAIFESNLDEFFMVRVSSLVEQRDMGVSELSPDGLLPREQLRQIIRETKPLRQEAAETFRKVIKPLLAEAGVTIRNYSELNVKQRKAMMEHFKNEIYPLCTPLIFHPAPTVPFISNRSLNLAVELEGDGNDTRLARVKIPTIVPRAVRLPGRKLEFILLEEVIQHHLDMLFPGVKIIGSYCFRVIRDADMEIRELDAADLISSIEETIRLRRFGDPVLLELQQNVPEHIKKILLEGLELKSDAMIQSKCPLGYEVFWEFGKIERNNLKYPQFQPSLAEAVSTTKSLFELVASGDVLVHHPFDSFRCVEEFVASAADDPEVIGIKQTLYRVGSESPIVESLLDAAESGKQVAAMVELKARFDESNNIIWARALERAGVHVTYGFAELKTHCKLSLIVRRENGTVKQYAHIGTGNYNPATARLYTDLGMFTCDPDITQDISELFNYLTGYSKQTRYRKLLVAPTNLREGILERIQNEVETHRQFGNGRIILKLNALVDPEAIEALYLASCAGVKIDCIVRGICCLRPGVPGMSENISVISVVGRFLEHSRVYYFGNNGSPKVLIGSADLMRRNLDRRIEVLVPVGRTELIDSIREILDIYISDNCQAWELNSKGEYIRRKSKQGSTFNAQERFMSFSGTKIGTLSRLIE